MKFDNEALKRVIEQKGYKTKWVADQLGLSVETMRSYLNGRRQPKRPTSRLLSHILNCSDETFWKKEGEAS